MTEQSTVFLVDDNALFRAGLRVMLESTGQLVVIGEASNGCDALPQIQNLRPNIAMIDLSMPHTNGADLIASLVKSGTRSKLIVLSQQNNTDWMRKILTSEIDAYILKSDGRDFILNAISAVQKGEKYFSPSVAKTFYELLTLQSTGSNKRFAVNPLSPKEQRVAELTAEGFTVKEIATALDCSENTVKTHLTNLMRKISARNAAEVASWVHSGS